jgi:glycosyltransferase involved in cell wall biosynthesis
VNYGENAVECGPADVKYLRNEALLGFGEACNWAFENLWAAGNDLLLLDPHSEVTAGFLEEMAAVLHWHERHAVVTPRTNSAAFFGLGSHDVWLKLRDSLPRYQIVPAAGPFCMLIKSEILERFSLFDHSFDSGIDQAHDFVCRINRCGFSALAANRAFVSYREPPSASEYVRSAVLTERYPEFDRRIAEYANFQIDPLETFAALYAPHKPRILYDLYHLTAHHSGTSDFALNLLREIAPLMSEEYDLYVGAGEAQAFFMPELRGYRLRDEQSDPPMVFDLVYKPCQLFRWAEFARMNRLAPRLAFTFLDAIAVRCDYIGNAEVKAVVAQTVELSDLVFTISEFSRSDFAAFYSVEAPMPVIYLGTHAQPPPEERAQGEYLLIMGNALAHKGVAEAVAHLGGDWPIVVLGGEEKQPQANVRWLPSGNLSRRFMHDLMVKARLLVYPSYYEGYGLPVADALALGKPVIVLDTAVNREIARNTGDPNLHLVSSSKDLHDAVQRVWAEAPQPPNPHPRCWADTGKEYMAAFEKLLRKDIDVDKLRGRWETVRFVESRG